MQHLAPVIEAVSDASAYNEEDEEEQFTEQEFTAEGLLTGIQTTLCSPSVHPLFTAELSIPPLLVKSQVKCYILGVTSNTAVFGLQSSPSIPPSQYRRPPNTAAHFQIWVLYVIYDSPYRRFRKTAAFSPVPRSAVLRGLTVPRQLDLPILQYGLRELPPPNMAAI